MKSAGYLFGEGFRSIFKHGFMSFATVTIIIACLIIMGSVLLLTFNIDALIQDLEDQNEVVAFVDESCTPEQAKAIQQELDALDNVETAQYVDRSTAMDNFMSNYDKSLMEGIDSSVFRDRYIIQLTDIAGMSRTKSELERVEGIVKVNAHVDYAESFITIRNIVSIVSIVLIGMLLFVSFFIMSNTIKLATFSRKEEIGIMRMVGASNTFIRMPFIIEGLILGLTGSLIAYAAQYGIYQVVTQNVVTGVTGAYLNVVPFAKVSSLIFMFFIGVGFLVGTFGGVNAIRNYLKV